MNSNNVADNQITVIDHTGVTRFDGGLVVYANDFRRNDNVVIKRRVVFPICIESVSK